MRTVVCHIAFLSRGRAWIAIEGQLVGLFRAQIEHGLAGLRERRETVEILLDLSGVGAVDTAGLEALGAVLPPGARLLVVEPRSPAFSSALVAGAFPGAALFPSVRALCDGAGVDAPSFQNVATG